LLSPPTCAPAPLHTQDLDDLFGRYGRILEIRLSRDTYKGRCKGFAFVAMSCENDVVEVCVCVCVCCVGARDSWGLWPHSLAYELLVLCAAAARAHTQCIRRLDRTAMFGHRLSVERARTDLS
jgi:hypothetical protein